MDAQLSRDLEDLRLEVRTFIHEHAPNIAVRAGVPVPQDAREASELRRWSAALYERGYTGQDWPSPWGHEGYNDPLTAYVITEELARAHVPGAWGFAPMASYALLQHGTDEQRAYFLPRIRSSEHIWCQLFSEPDAGSDLASLRTRAVPDRQGYVIRGQKVWSTSAQWADYGLLLARTDTDVPKHAGISLFALDMRLPGITVRPLRHITGCDDFNEVFLDDVIVTDAAMIGRPKQGWEIARGILGYERGNVGDASIELNDLVELLVAESRCQQRAGVPANENHEVRQYIAGYAALALASKALLFRRLSDAVAGVDNVAAGPLGKLVFSELNLAMVEFGLRLLGDRSVLIGGDPLAVDGGMWQDRFLYARSYTIGGGTSEVMRNLLAERALHLPRDPHGAMKAQAS